jgi:DNA-binding FadR family transcriptional regulator
MWQGDLKVADLTEARIGCRKSHPCSAFFRISKDELEAIDNWIGELKRLVSEGKQRQYPVILTIAKFHMMLAEATHNAVFPILLKVLVDVTDRVFKAKTISHSRLKTHIEFYRSIQRAMID